MGPDTVATVGRSAHGETPTDLLDFSANVNPEVPDGAEAVYRRAFESARSYPADRAADFVAGAAEYVGCSPRQVVPTAGGLAAIRLAVETADRPGDSVVVPFPSFGELAREGRLQGAQPRFAPHKRAPCRRPDRRCTRHRLSPEQPDGRRLRRRANPGVRGTLSRGGDAIARRRGVPRLHRPALPGGHRRRDRRAVADEAVRPAWPAGGVRHGDRRPALLTGVDLQHAHGARAGPVELYATVGLSNPAALPMDRMAGERTSGPTGRDAAGTVNLIVAVDRAIDDGGLATLVGLIAEAKAASLLYLAGFPGTTTDAVAVGYDPAGEATEFAGSAIDVGSAARAGVRDAVMASFRSRYASRAVPTAVADTEYGVVTEQRAEVFRP